LGGVSRSITVTQNKAQLVLNRTSISFPRAGSADEVALFMTNPDAANIGVDANTIPAGFLYRQNGDTLFFSKTTPNGTASNIAGTLTITASPGLSAAVPINQALSPINQTWLNSSSFWYFTNANCNDWYKELLQYIVDDAKSWSSSYNLVRFYFEKYTSSGNTHSLRYYYNPSNPNNYGRVFHKNVAVAGSDTNIKFVPNGGDNVGNSWLSYQDGLYQVVVGYMPYQEYILTADDYVNPTKITFTEDNEWGDWFTLITTATNTY
jgi:hypothetical protein